MTRLARLQDEAQAAIKAARDPAEKANTEGREMTAEERSQYDLNMAKAKELYESIKAAKKDAEIIAQAKALADEIGMPDYVGGDLDVTGGEKNDHIKRAKNLGLQVVESDQYKSLLKAYGGRIPDGARVHSDPIPVKALIVGGSATSGGAFVTPDQSGIVELLGRRPLTIRDVISVRNTGSDSVEFVRQTSHTNAAAPVPEATTAGPIPDPDTGNTAGVKPEGSWAFTRVPTSVKTIAEWVPATKRALADVDQLEGLIRDELVADLMEEEEDQIISGDGTGENLEGILSTSGTQAQAFVTDIFVTIRKAITAARVVGRAVPNAVGLNPADVETVDLARDGNNRFFGAGPFAFGPRTLWGVPILESEAIPAGTGIVADWSKAVLWDRQESTVTMTDSHADFFIRNLVAILAEERVAFGVTRPSAFVIADLTA